CDLVACGLGLGREDLQLIVCISVERDTTKEPTANAVGAFSLDSVVNDKIAILTVRHAGGGYAPAIVLDGLPIAVRLETKVIGMSHVFLLLIILWEVLTETPLARVEYITFARTTPRRLPKCNPGQCINKGLQLL